MLGAARQWVWVPLLCVLWSLGPVMGFCWSLSEPAEAVGTPVIRVMTWNTKYGGGKNARLLVEEIIRENPDIVLLQDSRATLYGLLGRYFSKWNVDSFGQYVVASRFPLISKEVFWAAYPGGKWPLLRYRLLIGPETVSLYNVHFSSPREGLSSFSLARQRPQFLPQAIRRIDNNAEERLSQARALREFIRQEQGPVIVAGDLNSTSASLSCLVLQESGLRDAFDEGGRGYGYTYGHFLLRNRFPWLNLSWMRLDHIMMSSHLQSRRCWTGTADASDHRPVIADLILKRH
jgi:hypothetical protein